MKYLKQKYSLGTSTSINQNYYFFKVSITLMLLFSIYMLPLDQIICKYRLSSAVIQMIHHYTFPLFNTMACLYDVNYFLNHIIFQS